MNALALAIGPQHERLAQESCSLLSHRGEVSSQSSDESTFSIAQLGPAAHCHAFRNGEWEIFLTGIATWPSDFEQEFGQDLEKSLLALRGPFLLVAKNKDRLILARDGAGNMAINYSWHDGHFVAASEAKAIIGLSGWQRELRPAAVAQYLTYSFIPGPETMLAGIFSLPPGHYLEIDLRKPCPVTPIRWFIAEQSTWESADWVDEFSRTFSTAVQRLIPHAGRTPALFLSGGLDSSCVAAELAKDHADSLETFSLHFGKKYPHELDHAQAVADFCHIKNHHEVLIRPKDFLPRLGEMIRALDEPIGDPVALPNYELARLVGREHRAVFNGEGGDPCFGGPKNFNMLLHHWYGLPAHRSDPRHREKQYLASYRRAYEELNRLLTPEFREQFNVSEVVEAPLHPWLNQKNPSFLNKLMLINQQLKGAHLILPKVERMLAAGGMRPLSPLFDEDIIRLSFAIPPTLKLKNGQEKIIMKKAFVGRLPDSILHRPKSGMRVPVHFWMQREMKRHARSILNLPKLKREGIFESDRVKQLLRYDIEEGPGRYGLRLWMLVTFQIWKEQIGL